MVAGPIDGVAEAVDRANRAGLGLPECSTSPGHSIPGMMARAVASAGSVFAAIDARRKPGSLPAYSNLDARPHPADLATIASRIGEHVASPVRFAAMVGAMHDDGVRVFVEVGPGSVLTALVGSILAGRPHLAVACDGRGRTRGFRDFLLMMAKAGHRPEWTSSSTG